MNGEFILSDKIEEQSLISLFGLGTQCSLNFTPHSPS